MGIAGTPHMILGVFNREANVDIADIPFDGGGEVLTNILGGHTDFGVVCLLGQIAGSVGANSHPGRLFAQTAPEFPDLPTLADKGYRKSSFSTTLGLAGPKGLDPAIVSKWEEALAKTLKDPKVIAIVEKIEGVVIDFKKGEDYKKELFANAAVFKEIAAAMPEKRVAPPETGTRDVQAKFRKLDPVRAEVSKHELRPGCSPFDTSGRTVDPLP